jgi:transcriptional regulator with XRE-family HTH domain
VKLSEQVESEPYSPFGEYVRSQRKLAHLSLRQVAEAARISNPYLSQIEHGMYQPSIAVIRGLADALSLSAETLVLLAAGASTAAVTESPGQRGQAGRTEQAIREDPELSLVQKDALLAVLHSFTASPDPKPRPAARPRAVRPRAVHTRAVHPRAEPPLAAPAPRGRKRSTTAKPNVPKTDQS